MVLKADNLYKKRWRKRKMMEVTIHVPGLKELAEAIMRLAVVKTEGSQTAAEQSPVVPVQQSPATQTTPVRQTTVAQAATTAPVQQTQVPTSAPSYTLDDLARAGMTLMDSGHQGDLQQLLAQFGVDALPALPPAQYGAFATALRGLGAQI